MSSSSVNSLASPGSSPKLDERVEVLRKRLPGLRRIEPITDFDIIPNEVSADPPQPLTIRPGDLWVDGRYQRNLSRTSLRLILNIIANFSWQKFRPPVVTRDAENRYIVIDGQHTAIAAASHPSIDKIPVMFVPMSSLQEQAGAFISHNTAMVRVTPIDLFYARIAAGDENAIAVQEVLSRHKIIMVRSMTPQTVEINQTLAINTLLKLMGKYGIAKFSQIVETASQCNLQPIRGDHFLAIADLLYESHPDEGKISPTLLAQLIASLNDAESLSSATRIAASTRSTKGYALAIYYRNRYRELYGQRK